MVYLIMKCLILNSIIIILFFFLMCSYKKKETFVLKSVHTLTYFDLNPLNIYVSKPESYIDKKYFDNVFFNVRHQIVHENKFNSDLALLPELSVINNKNINDDYPYDILCPVNILSFSIIQNESMPSIKTFKELGGKTLAVIKGGYVEDMWKQVITYYKFEVDPTLVYYVTDREIEYLLKSNKIDGMISLAPHPNATILYLSTVLKIRIVPWTETEKFADILMYTFKVLKKTKINLKYYNVHLYQSDSYIHSYGFDLCLFVNKNLNVSVVYNLTDLTFYKKDRTVRQYALLRSSYIPIHQGTKKWLSDKGYIIMSNSSNRDHCILLTGKSKCENELEKTAKFFYDRDLHYSTKPNEQNALSYLKKIRHKTNDKMFGHHYQNEIENSYQCFNNPGIKNKKDCIKINGIWDRPCFSNNECPFFKANQNYENTFGGCKKGFCEMPLNVIRKGYRQFQSYPLCHTSSSDSLFDCKITANMATPDYAFKNDRKQRLKNSDELIQRGIVI